MNHRFLDLQLRLPSGLDALEMELRKVLKENLVRGHVELTLSVDRATQQKAGYNRELVAGYLSAFEAARESIGLQGEPDLNAVLRLPGALQTTDAATATKIWQPWLQACCEQIGPLLEQLKTMRAREGEALAAILLARSTGWPRRLTGVAELRPEIEQRYQERLTQRLHGRDRAGVQSAAAAGRGCGAGRSQRHLGRAGADDHAHRALPRIARSGRRSGQEAGFSAAGDEPRGQHAAVEDRRRGRQGNAHHGTGAGDEGGDREGARADSERGISSDSCQIGEQS